MSDERDDELAARLRRAVSTMPVDVPEWQTLGGRVRRSRIVRTAARIGIPGLCAVLLIGGVSLLSRRDDSTGTDRTSPPTPFPTVVYVPTTVGVDQPTTLASVPPSGVPSRPDAPSADVPASWPLAGTTDAFGYVVDVRSSDSCVAVSITVGGVVRPLADACPSLGTFGAQLVDDQLVVVGSTPTAATVKLRTSAGNAEVPTYLLGPGRTWGAVLPPAAELISVDGSADATACPYRDLFAALSADAFTVPVALGVGACAPEAAGVQVSGTHVMMQGGLAVFRRTDGGWKSLGVSGVACEGDLPEPEASACAALDGWPRPTAPSEGSLVGTEFDFVTGPAAFSSQPPPGATVFPVPTGAVMRGVRGDDDVSVVSLTYEDGRFRYVFVVPTQDQPPDPPRRTMRRVVADFAPALPPGSVMGDRVVESCNVDGVQDPLLVTQFRTVDPTQPTVRPERAWQFERTTTRMNEVSLDRVACFPFRPGG